MTADAVEGVPNGAEILIHKGTYVLEKPISFVGRYEKTQYFDVKSLNSPRRGKVPGCPGNNAGRRDSLNGLDDDLLSTKNVLHCARMHA
jgi:hypothetical protein